MIFFEPKRIYNGPFDGYYDQPGRSRGTEHPDSEVPEGYYSIPLGKARIVREGAALTVLAYGTMVHVAEAVLPREGRRCRDHRPAHAGPARHRGCGKVGGKDRPMPGRPRGDAHLAASAPSSPRWCRSAASTTSKRRSSASPASTRPIRTASNGPISPGPIRIGEAIDKLLEA